MDSKAINTQELKDVENLKESLYNAINESGLSIVPIYYVVKDLMNEIIMIYNSELKRANATENVTEDQTEVTE